MKRILQLALVLGLVFIGLWVLARHQVAAAANGILDQQSALGGSGRASVGISPAQLELTLQDLVMVDPDTGAQLQIPSIRFSTPSWKPWHLTASTLSAVLNGGEKIRWTAEKAEAALVITPVPDLPLAEVRLEGQGWVFVSDRFWSLGLDRIDTALVRSGEENRYELRLDAAQLTPDPTLSEVLAPFGLSAPIESLTLAANLTFAAPIDRKLGPDGPQMVALDLSKAALIWGATGIVATGQLAADQSGLAEGEITLEVARHQDLIGAATAIGIMTPDQAGFLQKGLTAYADPDQPDVVTLTFTFAGGVMRLGPIPLGPAPRINSLQRQ